MKFLIGGFITVDLIFKMLITFFSVSLFMICTKLSLHFSDAKFDRSSNTLWNKAEHQIIEQLHLSHSKRKATITKFLYIGTSTIPCEVARKIFFTDH